MSNWIVALVILLLTGCQSIGIPQIQPPRYGVVTDYTIGLYNQNEWFGQPLDNGNFVRVIGPCSETDFQEWGSGRYCVAELVGYPSSPELQMWIPEDKILFAHETALAPGDDDYNIADFRVALMSLSAEEALSLVKTGYSVPNGESVIWAGDCIGIGASAEKITVPEGFYRNFLFPELTLICAPGITDASQERYIYSVAGDPNGSHDELYFSAR